MYELIVIVCGVVSTGPVCKNIPVLEFKSESSCSNFKAYQLYNTPPAVAIYCRPKLGVEK